MQRGFSSFLLRWATSKLCDSFIMVFAQNSNILHWAVDLRKPVRTDLLPCDRWPTSAQAYMHLLLKKWHYQNWKKVMWYIEDLLSLHLITFLMFFSLVRKVNPQWIYKSTCTMYRFIIHSRFINLQWINIWIYMYLSLYL